FTPHSIRAVSTHNISTHSSFHRVQPHCAKSLNSKQHESVKNYWCAGSSGTLWIFHRLPVLRVQLVLPQRLVSTAEGVNFTFCRKVVTKIPKQDNGAMVMEETTRVLRSCGYVQKDSKNGCKWANNHGVQILMCECDSNACNSAPTKFIPAIIYLVIISLTALGLSK
ncbi:unnamed protein product, partial [Allacma fusca]